MLIRSLLFLTLLYSGAIHAQPDSLFVTERDSTMAYAVVYPPLPDLPAFTLIGTYAMDSSRVAVRLGYKRGKPCGTYRAFYPDGQQLIFAVYGWGYLHGDWVEYDPFGRITVKGQYRNGQRDGTWAFRPQGIVGHYKDGLKNGSWKYYENDKLVRKEKWRKGVLREGSTFLFGNWTHTE